MPPILMWVLVVVAAAVCGALGYYFGGENRKRTAEAKIGSAEEEAKRIVNDAIKAAEQKRKETIIEAKDEAFKLKADADKEIKDRRAEISRQERRILCKADNLPNATSLTLPVAYGNISTLHQNSNLSRVAEGTGPMKPGNLRASVRCQFLRGTER